jgi:hypothetical protein
VTGLKALVVAAATALGALLAMGALLAALFEAQGFGRARDTEPRSGYLLALAFALAVSIGVPAYLWRRLLPSSAPGWALVTMLAAAGALLILGISVTAGS